MEKSIITKRIEHLRRDNEKITQTLIAMDGTDLEHHADNFKHLAIDAALRSELITCRMRHLLYDYTDVRKPEYLTSAAAVQGIIIREYSDMFEIELPCLFPHRKQRQSSEYLTDPLYFLLSQYTDSHPVRKYTDCVVCFVHEYNKDLPIRRIRDYDNLEQKQMLDVIAAFILQDDGGMCCDSYNTVALGDADKTRIFIMPRKRFCTWLAEQNME